MVTLRPGDAVPATYGGLTTVIACDRPRRVRDKASMNLIPRELAHAYDMRTIGTWRQRCFCSEPTHDYGADVVQFVWRDIVIEKLNVVASIQ